MSGIRLLFSEAWSSIRMNVSTTFAATMTVLIGMCLLGLFIALGTWVLSWSNHIQKELQVHVYFCSSVLPEGGCTKGATPAQEQAVKFKLSQDPHVKSVTFVSKEQAAIQMKKTYPTLYQGGGLANPLPDSWVVTPTQARYTPVIGQAICNTHYAGVEPTL